MRKTMEARGVAAADRAAAVLQGALRGRRLRKKIRHTIAKAFAKKTAKGGKNHGQVMIGNVATESR
jgi:hypothetical protein